VFIVAAAIFPRFAPVRDRFFYERDPSLSYPYNEDTVSGTALVLIGVIGPLFFVIFTQLLLRNSKFTHLFDDKLKDIHLSVIVLGEILAASFFCSNAIKVFVGRLRPDFYAYCDYQGYREALESGNFTSYLALTDPTRIGDFANCREDASDARLSFPSDHSSISFCGLTYMAFFLVRVITLINFKHHSVGMLLSFFSALVPTFSAALVAATRVVDYKHNVEDTIWGAMIGCFAAYVAFNANYQTRSGVTHSSIGYEENGLFSIGASTSPSSP